MSSNTSCVAFPRHPSSAFRGQTCTECYPAADVTGLPSPDAIRMGPYLAFCTQCGNRSTSSGAFCGHCGAALATGQSASQRVRQPVPQQGQNTARASYADPRYAYPSTRPGQVTAAAVLLFVIGGFGVLGSIFLISLGELAGVFVAIGLILLLVGGLEIWIGVALLQLQAWARTAGLVVTGVGSLFALVSAFEDPATGIVDLAVSAVIFGLLASRAAQEADW